MLKETEISIAKHLGNLITRRALHLAKGEEDPVILVFGKMYNFLDWKSL